MTEPQPAAPQLVDLAVAMRGWNRDDITAAMLAARQAGWDWERTAKEVWRLLWTEDGEPAALRAACRDPLRREPARWRLHGPGTGPTEDYREARAALDAKLGTTQTGDAA